MTMMQPVAPGLECVLLVDGKLRGVFHFQDEPRRETKSFLRHLGTKHSIEEVILLSGDRPAEVAFFAAGMGITEAYGGKSPEEKVMFVREKTLRSRTLYLGDGINDAPAMMAATAGIALGVNSDITSEAAGAVILQSSLTSVDELIHIGRRMRGIALTSAVGGMGLSLIGMAAAVSASQPNSGSNRPRVDRSSVYPQFASDDLAHWFAERIFMLPQPSCPEHTEFNSC